MTISPSPRRSRHTRRKPDPTATLRRVLERPYASRFWGESVTVHPTFVPTILGNGQSLLAFQPFNARPHYYIIRVDSDWHLNNDAAGQTIADHLDEIVDAIANEFGFAWSDDDGQELTDPRPWPALPDAHEGATWWPIQWPSGLTPSHPVANSSVRPVPTAIS